MTPERWRQVGDLFDAAVQVEPGGRRDWLRRACGDDDSLRVEVERLLAHDEEAASDGFLTPPGVSLAAASGVPTMASIVVPHPLNAMVESRSLLRSRLRELVLIYLLIFGLAAFWRHVVVRRYDYTISTLHAVSLATLIGIAVLLSSRVALSVARLRALELAMIGMLAVRVYFAQYWSMLSYSLRNDPMAAQRGMQNHVLLTSILILTCGIYVPKTWRRAVLLAGPLALAPFLTLLALRLRHPEAMGWLARPGATSGRTPLDQYAYDAMLMLILAVVSAWGANTIHRLRRQVVEASQVGPYRLRTRIGSGGMGEVYLADHQLLKRPCAVKLIRAGAAADPRAQERFEREVRMTAALSHWNTVEIFDYGRTDEGIYYYVMEYLPGLSLADLVERHGPQSPGRVVYLLRQVCLALREAHGAGLIHRDIKPSNIFAARRGGLDDVAKLLDFGLVLPKVQTMGLDPSGESRQVLGTPLFMSPEQALGGRELDERSDIYSLGTVAYYLLTATAPFVAGGGIEVMIAHAREPVVPPSHLVADVPDDLERVVLRCLAKDPAVRYQTADDLERALGACACAGDWDQERATRWWRDETPTLA